MVFALATLLQRCFTPNRVEVLSFPWVTDRSVTANMNAIKTESYNPSYFLKGRFGEKVQCNHTQFLAGTQRRIEGPGGWVVTRMDTPKSGIRAETGTE